MPVRVGRCATVATVVIVTLVTCSPGDDNVSPSSDPPPRSKAALVREFGPGVERLGLRITRAGLFELAGATDYTEKGRHLAVYVEPLGSADIESYVATVDRLAKVFLPEVFDRLPQIDTFDVCQEPPPGVDDREEPRVFTRLLIKRSEVAAIDWETIDARGMLAAALRAPTSINFALAPEVESSPAWQRIVNEAMKGTGRP